MKVVYKRHSSDISGFRRWVRTVHSPEFCLEDWERDVFATIDKTPSETVIIDASMTTKTDLNTFFYLMMAYHCATKGKSGLWISESYIIPFVVTDDPLNIDHCSLRDFEDDSTRYDYIMYDGITSMGWTEDNSEIISKFTEIERQKNIGGKHIVIGYSRNRGNFLRDAFHQLVTDAKDKQNGCFIELNGDDHFII
jgi:hypothetical protein